jgi:hypothetical protein
MLPQPSFTMPPETTEDRVKRYQRCLETNNYPGQLALMGREAFISRDFVISLQLFEKADGIDPNSTEGQILPFFAGSLICNGRIDAGKTNLTRLISLASGWIQTGDRRGAQSYLFGLLDSIECVRTTVPTSEEAFVKQKWKECLDLTRIAPTK